MNSVLFTLAVLFLPLLAVKTADAQSLGEITKALGNGDTQALASMMDAEVELSLLEVENLYSREDARQQLSSFFTANPPTAFSQVHQGSSKSDNAEYCIGNLSTANGSFRVYIYVAKKGDKMVLQELRFDRE